eukprot:4651652-Amphidinium_carterae.1
MDSEPTVLHLCPISLQKFSIDTRFSLDCLQRRGAPVRISYIKRTLEASAQSQSSNSTALLG